MENKSLTNAAAASTASLAPLAEIEKAADIVARSGLFGVKSKEEAATLMLVAQAEGSHFMTALREFYVIDGKPSLKADAILARFQKCGGKIRWIKRDEKSCKAVFSHPDGGEVEVEWTFEMAEKAGFTWAFKKFWNKQINKYEYAKDEKGSRIKETKDNWQRIPRQMLSARVVSEGVRAVCAGCLNGFYTPEELMDFDEGKQTPQSQPQAAEAEVVCGTPSPSPAKPNEATRRGELDLNLDGRKASETPQPLDGKTKTDFIDWLANQPEHVKDGVTLWFEETGASIGSLTKAQYRTLCEHIKTIKKPSPEAEGDGGF